jgi:citrate lyase subunit beta/citryl-CoA lyase
MERGSRLAGHKRRVATAGWPRTWLFSPADDSRKLASALRSDAGAVIADLEDAVAPERKLVARSEAARFARDGGGDAWRVVRINDPRTELGRADLEALRDSAPTAVMVPKATVDTVGVALASNPRVVPLIETALGVTQAGQIAATPGVIAVAFGSVDLSAELGLRPLPEGQELLYVRSELVVSCAAAGGLPLVDSVFVDLQDEDGLRAESERGRALGFSGKLCIHPRQVSIAEAAFTPSPEEMSAAHRTVEAYERGRRSGRGAVLDDGEMVDLATVRRAQRLLLGNDLVVSERDQGSA